MAQDAVIFPDAKHVRLRTPEARRVVAFFGAINDERLTHAQPGHARGNRQLHERRGRHLSDRHVDDRPVRAGIEHPGAAAVQQLRRLSLSAPVGPRTRRSSAAMSGWCPKRERTPAQRAAMARFFRFMAEHNFDWARTGHLPAFQCGRRKPAIHARCRTARISRRWPASASHCPAMCSARMRSRD